MTEVWLRTNRRALAWGTALPLFIIALGIGTLVTSQSEGWGLVGTCGGGLVILAGLVLLGPFLFALFLPRLAYESESLLVYVGSAEPIKVPIDIVECFFLGQGAAALPKLNSRDTETSNVIVRLAESAVDWHHRDVDVRFAHWCEGYITISGAWCEPINGERLKALNHRLAEVHRQRKQARLAAQEAAR